jgi:Methyltransferase domain
VEIEAAKKTTKAEFIVSDTRMQLRLVEPLRARGGQLKIHIAYHYNIPGEGGKLLSIHIAPKDDRALAHALACAGIGQRVELVTADANTVLPDGDYAFAFIDGDHSYEGARRDHNRWGRRVSAGGVIIHHDMSNNRRHPTQIAPLARLREDIIRQQEGVLSLERETGSIAIFRRTDARWIDVQASVQTVSA